MIVERLRLDGRTVIVAGAGGGGIGTLSVQAMLEAGATVVGVDRDDSALAAVIERFQGQAFIPIAADVRTDAGIATIVDAARATGRVDGLVNVIGGTLINGWAPSLDYTREQWRDVFDLNVDYVMFLGQAVARAMIDFGRGGSIVNVASTSGIAAAPYHVAYGASKAGVVSLTRTMAVEWGRHGIRVNVIAPGSINTPRAMPEPPDRRDRAVPLHRRGEPFEIASTALFLISDLSSYISAQLIPVDGGMSWKWAHLGDDNEPIFVNNNSMLAKMGLPPRAPRTE